MTKSLPKSLSAMVSCAAFGIAACAAQEATVVRAYDVSTVHISVEGSGYRIRAEGRMRTGGHANPRLRPVGTIANGELVLELVADAPRPGAMTAMFLQPVSAAYRVGSNALKFVVVISETTTLRHRLPHVRH